MGRDDELCPCVQCPAPQGRGDDRVGADVALAMHGTPQDLQSFEGILVGQGNLDDGYTTGQKRLSHIRHALRRNTPQDGNQARTADCLFYCPSHLLPPNGKR